MAARGRLALLWLAALALGFPSRAALAAPVDVFAAASLQGALDEVARAHERSGGAPVRTTYASSAALARQIDAGAPAQLFVSADPQWTGYLERRGRLAAPAAPLLGNGLVLIAPRASAVRLRIGPGLALAEALGPSGRLALGDPASVPAGQYARAALRHFGAWEAVRLRIAPTDNVRNALALVARGEAPLGIVYRTDAMAEPRVRVVDAFPAGSHPPVVYPLAIVRGAGPEARAFAAFAASPAARAIWARHGFGDPGTR